MKSYIVTPAKLRFIAEKYFTDPSSITEYCGICANLSNEFDKDEDTDYIYDQMEHFLYQLGYWDSFHIEVPDPYDNSFTREGWQSRAYMCLLMAEMIEDGTLKPLYK
jgi:hypothetical protein